MGSVRRPARAPGPAAATGVSVVAVVAGAALAVAPAGAAVATTPAPAGVVVGRDVFWPAAVDTDPAGRPVVVESGQPELGQTDVLRLDPGDVVGVPVAGGSGSGLRNYPSGVAVDAAGLVYVADTYNHRVLRFDGPGRPGTLVAGGPGTGPGNLGAGLDRLNTPTKIQVDAAGRLYVVDTTNDRVVRWDPGAGAGVVVAGGRGRGTAADQLTLPAGLHVGPDGTVDVADTQNHRVVRWAPGATRGVVMAGGNGAGAGPGQLRGPAGVAVDTEGRVLVADTQNHRVVRWVSGAGSGEVVAGGTRGAGLDQLDQPTDVLALGGEAFVVTDRRNERVLRFGPVLYVVATPETRRLMSDLGTAAGFTVLPSGDDSSFLVPGCPAGPVPLPAADRDYPALLGGPPYPALDGTVAGPVPESCAPDAVTLVAP
jgi:sugar lactone lactonase YvrE